MREKINILANLQVISELTDPLKVSNTRHLILVKTLYYIPGMNVNNNQRSQCYPGHGWQFTTDHSNNQVYLSVTFFQVVSNFSCDKLGLFYNILLKFIKHSVEEFNARSKINTSILDTFRDSSGDLGSPVSLTPTQNYLTRPI